MALGERATDLSAIEQARRIRARELTASEAVEAAITRIRATDTALKAVVVRRFDEARREARAADLAVEKGEPLGPLQGVPVTVKECLDLVGTPTTNGLGSRASHRAELDERHVARLRASGAIIVGKTNVSQLLLYMEADNPLYGRTNNPWDGARTPGGSSGGEGAIIAAGGSALGLGTDIGGSVRNPAAFCGVCGFKPTAGRCPDEGRLSAPFGQRAVVSQVGVLAREVADVALGFEVIHGGHEPSDPAARRLADWSTVDVRGLRVGWFDDDGTFTPASAVGRAVREAAAALNDAGADVFSWTPPRISRAQELYYSIMGADGFRGAKRTLGADKRDLRIALFEKGGGLPRPLLRGLAAAARLSGRKKLALMTEVGGARSADEWFQIVEAQHDYRLEVMEAMRRDRVDVLLGPANGLPAFRHGATRELVMAGMYTALYNLLGFPAGVVPVTRVRQAEESAASRSRDVMDKVARETEKGSAGMPVAVQLAALPFYDHHVLAAMRAVESRVRATRDFPKTPIDPEPMGRARLQP